MPGMRYLNAFFVMSGDIGWQVGGPGPWEREHEEGIRIAFHLGQDAFGKRRQRREVLSDASRAVRDKVPWIVSGSKTWAVDLGQLRAWIESGPAFSQAFADFPMGVLTGRVSVEPEVEQTEQVLVDGMRIDSSVVLYLSALELGRMPSPSPVPPEIAGSLEQFNTDNDGAHVGFLMMRFGNTPAHTAIAAAVREIGVQHGIRIVRADDKEYHPDLFYNVMTYMHGSLFGVAVFERLEQEEFNPNVSLEVGYMVGLRKEVCLLKDQTLRLLQADLIGRLDRQFDPQDPSTIGPVFESWLQDKTFI